VVRPAADARRRSRQHDEVVTESQVQRVLAGAVAAVGLHQAGVPLIARGVFGAEQRFAPVAALPAPWWWLTCAALTIVMAIAVLALAPRDAPGEHPTSTETAEPGQPASDEAADQGWEALSGFVVLVALYNGVAPFVVRLVLGGDLLLALPLYLPAPWWWLAAGFVVVAAAAALVTIDRARHRSDDEGDAVASSDLEGADPRRSSRAIRAPDLGASSPIARRCIQPGSELRVGPLGAAAGSTRRGMSPVRRGAGRPGRRSWS